MNIDAQFNALSWNPSQWQRLKLSEPGGDSQKYTSASNGISFSISGVTFSFSCHKCYTGLWQSAGNYTFQQLLTEWYQALRLRYVLFVFVRIKKKNNFHSFSKPKPCVHHMPNESQCFWCLDKTSVLSEEHCGPRLQTVGKPTVSSFHPYGSQIMNRAQIVIFGTSF